MTAEGKGEEVREGECRFKETCSFFDSRGAPCVYASYPAEGGTGCATFNELRADAAEARIARALELLREALSSGGLMVQEITPIIWTLEGESGEDLAAPICDHDWRHLISVPLRDRERRLGTRVFHCPNRGEVRGEALMRGEDPAAGEQT